VATSLKDFQRKRTKRRKERKEKDFNHVGENLFFFEKRTELNNNYNYF